MVHTQRTKPPASLRTATVPMVSYVNIHHVGSQQKRIRSCPIVEARLLGYHKDHKNDCKEHHLSAFAEKRAPACSTGMKAWATIRCIEAEEICKSRIGDRVRRKG